MSTKRGARAAPRSTSERTAVPNELSLDHVGLKMQLKHIASRTNLVMVVDQKVAARLVTAIDCASALSTDAINHERKLESLRQQLSTVQALVRGAAEAFDGTPTGQVLAGLDIQIHAVVKGGAR
ncbi:MULTISPECIES: hypothetical protein [unclassified Corallococcus]|uniref:hypothetical protein n=1 Tax=unclassified Corallococcus TaxID=2685029 RepID=UPI001A8C69DA|nr:MULTISPECIES: hypothetical protein [unclassified Corallococcus]MBN9687157.1 hypothetical protein [Corallococcus sp. NCSPR001]WAS89016.1 hypothetical protein O0N60_19035 [Corallococcus sp. NCRR]